MGLPRVGKTLNAEALERKLRELGFEVRFIPDLIKNAPLPSGNELEKNRWSIRETGNLLLEAKEGPWQVVIGDRLGWAHFASVEALVRAGLVSQTIDVQKAMRIQRIAMDVVNDEDFFVLIKVPVPLIIERHLSLGGSMNGVIMKKETLVKMEEVYTYIESRLPKRQMLVLNGEADVLENQSLILERVKRHISSNNHAQGGESKRIINLNGVDNNGDKEEYYGLGGSHRVFFN